MINAEVTKSGNENTMSMIRKFTRRMQSTGIVQRMRGRRYWSRPTSPTVKKKQALKRIEKKARFEQLLKEGKVTEQPRRHGGMRR